MVTIKIANPIFDTVFKYLMENRRIARFFIETLIGEQVIEIAVVPQEYVYRKVIRKETKNAQNNETEVKTEEVFSIIRYDFVATICNDKGEHKKVLIEIQKSRKYTDLLRFRKYLGEQYKRVDVINTKTGEVEKSLPIISIYLLGFKLPKHNTQAFKVARYYFDLIAKRKMNIKDDLAEALTHDGYFVQIPRIKGKPRNVLEKMLSVFEQKYFIDEKEIVKTYEHQVDNDIIKEMLDVLRNVAADPEEMKAIEAEWLAVKDDEGYEQALKTIEEQGNTIAKQENTIADMGNTIAKKDSALAAMERENAEKDNVIAELRRQLELNKN